MLRNLLSNSRWWPGLAVVALLAAVAGVATSTVAGVSASTRPAAASAAPAARPASADRLTGGASPLAHRPRRPNIVFVLTDDLSLDLLSFMPHVQELQRHGLTFADYFVSDSLCCPSRSSILTGDFPHNTGVFSNVGTEGGFHLFHSRGEELSTFAVALQRAGYMTGLMGKYLNGYLNGQGTPLDVPATYVPPGWNAWDVGGQAYPEFNYTLNENGTLRFYGHGPSDYLTDVLAGKGVSFISQAAAAGRPFFLELATFAPHSPYLPAPRNRNDFPGLTAPRPPNFNLLPSHPPRWLAGHHALRAGQLEQINSVFRRRAQSVQAVDQMVAQIEDALTANGLADNTYLLFSSDNGLHTGEYRLMPGKMTAFDTDIRVPLIVAGPGVPAGARTDALAENVDLARTFAAIGGTTLPSDGRSLLPLLHGQQSGDWRSAILVEHHGPDLRGVDPDFQQPASGNPRTYAAMRTRSFLYVEYDDGEQELYDLRRDPFELNNLADRLTAPQQAVLRAQLAALESCHGGASCWMAMHPEGAPRALERRVHHRSARSL